MQLLFSYVRRNFVFWLRLRNIPTISYCLIFGLKWKPKTRHMFFSIFLNLRCCFSIISFKCLCINNYKVYIFLYSFIKVPYSSCLCFCVLQIIQQKKHLDLTRPFKSSESAQNRFLKFKNIKNLFHGFSYFLSLGTVRLSGSIQEMYIFFSMQFQQ